MPFLILIGLLAVGLVWRLWARDRAKSELGRRLDPVARRVFSRKPCRWQRVGRKNATFEEYRCDKCGITAYSQTGGPPETCKKGLGGGL